jgi:hypothetical protein
MLNNGRAVQTGQIQPLLNVLHLADSQWGLARVKTLFLVDADDLILFIVFFSGNVSVA